MLESTSVHQPPTVAEAEEADKAALQEVYSLCYAGATLDDALSSVTVDRDLATSAHTAAQDAKTTAWAREAAIVPHGEGCPAAANFFCAAPQAAPSCCESRQRRKTTVG